MLFLRKNFPLHFITFRVIRTQLSLLNQKPVPKRIKGKFQFLFPLQSILKMNGFRQLNEAEEVEVEFKVTDTGLLEAIKVTGPNGEDCRGSSKHPPKRVFRKIRCYNCGEFKNHVGKGNIFLYHCFT